MSYPPLGRELDVEVADVERLREQVFSELDSDPAEEGPDVSDELFRSLQELSPEQQQQFARDKETSLPEYCRRCDMRFVCNGECPKNRFLRAPDGESGLNYLCEGYHRFFRHIDPVMKEMAEELRHGRPAMNVMYRRNAATRSPKRQRGPRSGKIGRNDPCPCESGRKYKQCCMRRARLRPRPR